MWEALMSAYCYCWYLWHIWGGSTVTLSNFGIWVSHSGDCEVFCLLGYNDALSRESKQTFRRNISPPSSRSKSKPRKRPAWRSALLRPWQIKVQWQIQKNRSRRNEYRLYSPKGIDTIHPKRRLAVSSVANVRCRRRRRIFRRYNISYSV
jgi:hypothetical protein